MNYGVPSKTDAVILEAIEEAVILETGRTHFEIANMLKVASKLSGQNQKQVEMIYKEKCNEDRVFF